MGLTHNVRNRVSADQSNSVINSSIVNVSEKINQTEIPYACNIDERLIEADDLATINLFVLVSAVASSLF